MLTSKKWYSTLVLIYLAGFTGAGSFSASADIYMYIDQDGILHFTNTPSSSDEKLYMKDPTEATRTIKMPDRYDKLIQKAANQYKIAFLLLKALIKVESDFDPLAVSQTGAKGLMQIMPENMVWLRIKNPFDPAENVMGGARYLKYLIEKFEKNIPLALAAYNAGPEAVRRYGKIPPFDETEMFVNKVITFYNLLKLNNY